MCDTPRNVKGDEAAQPSPSAGETAGPVSGAGGNRLQEVKPPKRRFPAALAWP